MGVCNACFSPSLFFFTFKNCVTVYDIMEKRDRANERKRCLCAGMCGQCAFAHMSPLLYDRMYGSLGVNPSGMHQRCTH